MMSRIGPVPAGRHSHPDSRYMTVPPFHSSLHKSVKQFGLSFAFDALQIWNDFHNDIHTAYLLPPSGRSSKLTCLQKPICGSLSITPVSSWYDPAKLLYLVSVNWWRLSAVTIVIGLT